MLAQAALAVRAGWRQSGREPGARATVLAPEQGCGWRREPLGSSEPPCGTAGLAWRSGSAAAGSRDRAGRTARRGDLLAAAGGLQPQGAAQPRRDAAVGAAVGVRPRGIL